MFYAFLCWWNWTGYHDKLVTIKERGWQWSIEEVGHGLLTQLFLDSRFFSQTTGKKAYRDIPSRFNPISCRGPPVTLKKSKTANPETGWASNPGKILASNLEKIKSATFQIVRKPLCACSDDAHNHSANARILRKPFRGRSDTVQTILRTPGYYANHSAEARILRKPYCGRPGYCPNHSADARSTMHQWFTLAKLYHMFPQKYVKNTFFKDKRLPQYKDIPFELVKTYFPWNEDIRTSLRVLSFTVSWQSMRNIRRGHFSLAWFETQRFWLQQLKNQRLLGSMSRSPRCGGRISPLAVHKRRDDCHNATVS